MSTPPPRRRGARVRVAENIYQDDKGLCAIASAAGKRREKSFPLGISLKKIAKWIEDERAKMRAGKATLRRISGTLDGDIVRYLADLPDGQAKKNTGWELGAWSASPLGPMRRDKITVADLRRVVNGWIEAEVPASTINHRRRALAQLWESLDGKAAPNPMREVKRAKEVLGDPTSYPMDALSALIDGMDATRGRYYKRQSSFRLTNKSQARLRMLLWTGMPPIGLRALNPRRVARELEQAVLWYPRRAKGNGADAVLLPLFPAGRAACTAWLKAMAGGSFSEASLDKALKRAAATYAQKEAAAGRSSPVPTTISPYHLRHSFLTWLYETTGDPYLVQLYGQHADLETTKRYTRGGVPKRAREAVAQIAALATGTDGR